jgi:WD40 repeat protein
LWDLDSSIALPSSFKGHTNRIISVAFSPNGKQIVSGSNDRSIRVWEVETGDVLFKLIVDHTDRVLSVAFSPDGTRIVSGSNDLTIRVWDAATGKKVAGPLKGHKKAVSSVAFSPDGNRIVSGSDDRTVRVWDAQTGKEVCEPFEGHTEWIFAVAVSPDATKIALSSDHQTIRIWDATDVLSNSTASTHNARCDTPAIFPYHVVPGFEVGITMENGWMQGPNSELLFWVTPTNRTGLWRPRNTAVISNVVIVLDFSRFVHGDSWQRCRFGG